LTTKAPCVIIANMKHFITMKVFEGTRKMLRLISAITDESLSEVIDRLAKEELKQIKEQEYVLAVQKETEK
jgi:hypothetical protein